MAVGHAWCQELRARVTTILELGTIQILRNQNSGWVGLAKCLCLLTKWVGGFGKMLT